MRLKIFATAAAPLLLCTAPVIAGDPINYGDFNGTDFMYLGVTESSGTDDVPLFGVPDISGNTLLFNNMTFTASSSGGGAPDITDGQLNTTIMSLSDDAPINQLLFEEEGDYTLSGLQGEALVTVGTAFFINILEIDGQSVDAIGIDQSLLQMLFVPESEFSLSDEGMGTAEPWSGSLLVDLEAVLADLGLEGGVTKLSVTLDNTLTAASTEFTSAFIAKKEFGGVTMTAIPAPGALVLIGMAGLVGGRRRRRR